MKPCARLSGLCGLAALVAGVVAISFLATHASAVDDLCANVDCGEATCAMDVDTPVCVCKDGLVFDEAHKKCVDLCANLDCGEGFCSIDTDPVSAFAECVCKPGFEFDEDNKTCVDPCAGVECGVEASCLPFSPTEFECKCQKEGLSFNEADKTCFASVVRTTVEVQASGNPMVGTAFLSPVPAEQASGSTACSDLYTGTGAYTVLQGTTKVTVVWNDSKPCVANMATPKLCFPLTNAMCKRLSFYAGPDCTEKLVFTIARPAKKGRSYPVTKRTVKRIFSPVSVGCEMTMCENDCGTAQCVVKEGKPQCQCPEGLVFNAAKKLCRDPSLAPRRAGGQGKKG